MDMMKCDETAKGDHLDIDDNNDGKGDSESKNSTISTSLLKTSKDSEDCASDVDLTVHLLKNSLESSDNATSSSVNSSFTMIAESVYSSELPPPSSASSSSSSSLAEQSEVNIASSSSSSFKASSFEVPSSGLFSQALDVTGTTCDIATAPVVQKRGPGRPRKDGSVPIQRKKPQSNPFLRASGRPRGRRRHIQGDRTQLNHNQLSGLSMQQSDVPKIGEPAVALISQPLDNQERVDPIELDSDNSLSSAVSNERSASEELFQEQWSGKMCAFCNLGERSLLGQGEMTRFEPTVGFNPFRKSPKARRGSSETEREIPMEKNVKPSTWRRQKGRSRERSKSPRRSDDDSNSQPVDELSVVGFAEEPDISMLFEHTGHTYAHHCCAAWSDGVCQTEDYLLIKVDKAVAIGMSQKCSSCKRYGATIHCRGPKCNKVYHYPCAASSGAFQDIKTMSLLCPQHHYLAPSIDKTLRTCHPLPLQSHNAVIDTADTEANCIQCDTPGNISELLFCTSCGHHYHGQCLDQPVAVNPVVRAGWQCNDCKICLTCKQPGDDNKMLVCDTCDKGYHIYCLRPVMTSIPKHGWKCKNCRVCGDCGARTPGSGPSSRWHMNYTVCDSCYQQRNKGLACRMCGRAYRHFAQKEMVQCNLCKKFVHEKCDTEIDVAVIQQQRDTELSPEYLCPFCRPSSNKGSPRLQGSSARFTETKELTWPTSSGKFLSSLKEDSNVSESSLLIGPNDSLLTINEDSVCSMDIDIQAIERSAQQLQQLSGNSSFGLFDDPPSGKAYPLPASKPLSSLGKLAGKKRIGIGRPRGSTKFAGMKRRAKVAEFGKRRGPKPKLKQIMGLNPFIQAAQGDLLQVKMDEEPGLENKIVLCSTKDEFVLSQDMCVMCGSYGQGEEGRLIACSQCGQCYHPYCVAIKVTKVLLSKGWRCLDCTVCEGCGQPHDEGRLILCDDCDISYHIYCLDPPLEQVPPGNWKCKWCVVCLLCGSTSPGQNSEWQCNYTQCGPCSSLITCPVCHLDYKDDDLIIQCIECDRWLHAGCDAMQSEDDAEISADYGYHCILCRPKDQLPPHLLPPPALPLPKLVEPPKPPTPPIQKPAPDPPVIKVKPQPQFFVDGVELSESGMDHIKSLIIEQPKKTRMRRTKLQPAAPCRQLSFDSKSDGRLSEDLDDLKPLSTDLDNLADGEKMDVVDDDVGKDSLIPEEVPVEKKKRQRNLQKLGVGGFIVRPRGRSSSYKDHDKAEPLFSEQGETSFNDGGHTTANDFSLTAIEKPRRKRRIKKKSQKSQLEDSFPSYLQEAFFGKNLLDTSKEHEGHLDDISDEEVSLLTKPMSEDKIVTLIEEQKTTSSEQAIVQESLENSPKDSAKVDEDGLGDSEELKDILPLAQALSQDDELVKMLMNESDDLSKTESLNGIGETAMTRDDMNQEVSNDASKDDQLNKDDPLTDILSPHFNLETMVGDSGLPQMDGKEVEDLFKGVLTDDVVESPVPDSVFPLGTAAMPQPTTVASGATPASVQRPPIPANLRMPSPFSVPPPSPYPSEYSSSPQFSPGFSEPPPSPWVPPEPDVESPSYSQRSILKWEADENLGCNATISAVLYANINHPELKGDYPNWSDRCKQIAKIWRGLPSEKRTQYVQKARENRAACRMQKAQQEQERFVREQKSHKEQEQERQWKQLQTLRQQQAQQQQQILQEQRAQVVPTQPHPLPTLPAMVRVQQQQVMNAENVRSHMSHAGGGTSAPSTPSSPGQLDPYSSTPGTPIPVPPTASSEVFSQQPHPMHSTVIQDSICHSRMSVPGQLHVATSQGQTIVSQLSPHSQITSNGNKIVGTFPSPIQVSRVRPPIDPSQMHSSNRIPSNDLYSQMPGTPRPVIASSGQDPFVRPQIQHRSVSPHINRTPVRLPDPYSRQPFTPRPQPTHEMPLSPAVVKQHHSSDMFSKQPMTPQPACDPVCSTPRPEVFHTPPSTPHPQTPTPDPYVQPKTPGPESFPPPANTPRPGPSPFSPQQPNQSLHTHIQMSPDPCSSQPQTPRSSHQQDVYVHSPQNSRPNQQDMYVQASPQSHPQSQDMNTQPSQMAHIQDPFTSIVGASRTRSKPSGSLEHFSPGSCSPHSSPSGCDSLETHHSQGVEHFSQPRTPSVPLSSLSPLDDPYSQSPMTPRSHPGPQTSAVTVGGMGRSADMFPLSSRSEGDVSEQLLRARGMVSPNAEPERSQLMARQHLRDLLQKQQMKKQMEQNLRDHQSQMPLRHWPLDHSSEPMDSSGNIQQAQPSMLGVQEGLRPVRPPLVKSPSELPRQVGPRGLGMDSGFRQPYPPNVRPRVAIQGVTLPVSQHALGQPLHGQPQALIGQQYNSGQASEVQIRGIPPSDPSVRMTFQQQRLVHPSHLRAATPRMPSGYEGGQHNSVDHYDHLIQVQQQQQHLQKQQQHHHHHHHLIQQQHRIPHSQPQSVTCQGQSQMGISQGSSDPVDMFNQPLMGQLPTHQLHHEAVRQRMIVSDIVNQSQVNAMSYNSATMSQRLHPELGQAESQQIRATMPIQEHQDSHMLGEHDTLLSADLDSDVGTASEHGADLQDVPLQGDATTADKVAEELQKLEKESESHTDQKLNEQDDDLDDDELLGLGNDFNILEYADPELDKDIVGDGKKTNILDENLDLDDKDEDLDDDEEKSKMDSPDKVSIIKRELDDHPPQEEVTSKHDHGDAVGKQSTSTSSSLGPTDFQAKFLEFSQRRELEKAEELKNSDMFEEDSLESGVGVKLEDDAKSNVDASVTRNTATGLPSSAGNSNTSLMQDVPSEPVQAYHPVGSAPPILQPMVTPQRPLIGHFGQPPVSLPPELHQQQLQSVQPQQHLPLSSQPHRLSHPPPYPGGVTNRPPPPYQAIPNIRGQLNPRAFVGRQIVALPGHTGVVVPGAHGYTPNLVQPRSGPVPEQRLLLADLLEQEKQEQRRQQQQQHGLLTQPHGEDNLLSDIDFEKLQADVLGTSGPPVSISPPVPAVPAQGMLPLQPGIPASPSLRAASPAQGPVQSPGLPLGISHDSAQNVGFAVRTSQHSQTISAGPRMIATHDSGMHPALMQSPRPPFPISSLPPPPAPPSEPVTDVERQQQLRYEHWLYQQQQILGNQQKYFENEVAKLRKTRKSLNTKQRNLRKNGQQLMENDAKELERITNEQNGLQKQLEQIRKQSRHHAMIMQEYHNKQQKRQQPPIITAGQQMPLQQTSLGPPPSPMMNAPSTPMSPLLSPSPLGPSPSPIRQQSPSPMMQASPLGPVPSPLMQHSPHGQQMYQQSSPRMPSSSLEQQVMRPSALQVSQEDNNPFSETFQHRELRPQTGGRQLNLQQNVGINLQDDIEEHKLAIPQLPCYREESVPFSSSSTLGWGTPTRPTCSLPSEPQQKPVQRYMQGVGQRMLSSLGGEIQHSHFTGAPVSGMEVGTIQCASTINAQNSPVQYVTHSPKQFPQSSSSCNQPERNSTTPLGTHVQTPSPCLLTGSVESMSSALVNALGSHRDSHQVFHSQHQQHNVQNQCILPDGLHSSGKPVITNVLGGTVQHSSALLGISLQDGTNGHSITSPSGQSGDVKRNVRDCHSASGLIESNLSTSSVTDYNQDESSIGCPSFESKTLMTTSGGLGSRTHVTVSESHEKQESFEANLPFNVHRPANTISSANVRNVRNFGAMQQSQNNCHNAGPPVNRFTPPIHHFQGRQQQSPGNHHPGIGRLTYRNSSDALLSHSGNVPNEASNVLLNVESIAQNRQTNASSGSNPNAVVCHQPGNSHYEINSHSRNTAQHGNLHDLNPHGDNSNLECPITDDALPRNILSGENQHALNAQREGIVLSDNLRFVDLCHSRNSSAGNSSQPGNSNSHDSLQRNFGNNRIPVNQHSGGNAHVDLNLHVGNSNVSDNCHQHNSNPGNMPTGGNQYINASSVKPENPQLGNRYSAIHPNSGNHCEEIDFHLLNPQNVNSRPHHQYSSGNSHPGNPHNPGTPCSGSPHSEVSSNPGNQRTESNSSSENISEVNYNSGALQSVSNLHEENSVNEDIHLSENCRDVVRLHPGNSATRNMPNSKNAHSTEKPYLGDVNGVGTRYPINKASGNIHQTDNAHSREGNQQTFVRISPNCNHPQLVQSQNGSIRHQANSSTSAIPIAGNLSGLKYTQSGSLQNIENVHPKFLHDCSSLLPGKACSEKNHQSCSCINNSAETSDVGNQNPESSRDGSSVQTSNPRTGSADARDNSYSRNSQTGENSAEIIYQENSSSGGYPTSGCSLLRIACNGDGPIEENLNSLAISLSEQPQTGGTLQLRTPKRENSTIYQNGSHTYSIHPPNESSILRNRGHNENNNIVCVINGYHPRQGLDGSNSKISIPPRDAGQNSEYSNKRNQENQNVETSPKNCKKNNSLISPQNQVNLNCIQRFQTSEYENTVRRIHNHSGLHDGNPSGNYEDCLNNSSPSQNISDVHPAIGISMRNEYNSDKGSFSGGENNGTNSSNLKKLTNSIIIYSHMPRNSINENTSQKLLSENLKKLHNESVHYHIENKNSINCSAVSNAAMVGNIHFQRLVSFGGTENREMVQLLKNSNDLKLKFASVDNGYQKHRFEIENSHNFGCADSVGPTTLSFMNGKDGYVSSLKPVTLIQPIETVDTISCRESIKLGMQHLNNHPLSYHPDSLIMRMKLVNERILHHLKHVTDGDLEVNEKQSAVSNLGHIKPSISCEGSELKDEIRFCAFKKSFINDVHHSFQEYSDGQNNVQGFKTATCKSECLSFNSRDCCNMRDTLVSLKVGPHDKIDSGDTSIKCENSCIPEAPKYLEVVEELASADSSAFIVSSRNLKHENVKNFASSSCGFQHSIVHKNEKRNLQNCNDAATDRDLQSSLREFGNADLASPGDLKNFGYHRGAGVLNSQGTEMESKDIEENAHWSRASHNGGIPHKLENSNVTTCPHFIGNSCNGNDLWNLENLSNDDGSVQNSTSAAVSNSLHYFRALSTRYRTIDSHYPGNLSNGDTPRDAEQPNIESNPNTSGELNSGGNPSNFEHTNSDDIQNTVMLPNNGGNPNNPRQSNNGGSPSNPKQPKSGSSPNNPGRPNSGGNSYISGRPHDESSPNNQHQPNDEYNPNNPGQPNDAGSPNNSGQSNNGGGSNNSSQSNNGGSSNNSGQSSSGGNSNNPGQPNNGGNSNNPRQPNNGGNSNNPRQPNNGGSPNDNEQSSNEDSPNNPEQPSNGDSPDDPEQANNSGGNPVDRDSEGNPDNSRQTNSGGTLNNSGLSNIGDSPSSCSNGVNLDNNSQHLINESITINPELYNSGENSINLVHSISGRSPNNFGQSSNEGNSDNSRPDSSESRLRNEASVNNGNNSSNSVVSSSEDNRHNLENPSNGSNSNSHGISISGSSLYNFENPTNDGSTNTSEKSNSSCNWHNTKHSNIEDNSGNSNSGGVLNNLENAGKEGNLYDHGNPNNPDNVTFGSSQHTFRITNDEGNTQNSGGFNSDINPSPGNPSGRDNLCHTEIQNSENCLQIIENTVTDSSQLNTEDPMNEGNNKGTLSHLGHSSNAEDLSNSEPFSVTVCSADNQQTLHGNIGSENGHERSQNNLGNANIRRTTGYSSNSGSHSNESNVHNSVISSSGNKLLNPESHTRFHPQNRSNLANPENLIGRINPYHPEIHNSGDNPDNHRNPCRNGQNLGNAGAYDSASYPGNLNVVGNQKIPTDVSNCSSSSNSPNPNNGMNPHLQRSINQQNSGNMTSGGSSLIPENAHSDSSSYNPGNFYIVGNPYSIGNAKTGAEQDIANSNSGDNPNSSARLHSDRYNMATEVQQNSTFVSGGDILHNPGNPISQTHTQSSVYPDGNVNEQPPNDGTLSITQNPTGENNQEYHATGTIANNSIKNVFEDNLENSDNNNMHSVEGSISGDNKIDTGNPSNNGSLREHLSITSETVRPGSDLKRSDVDDCHIGHSQIVENVSSTSGISSGTSEIVPNQGISLKGSKHSFAVHSEININAAVISSQNPEMPKNEGGSGMCEISSSDHSDSMSASRIGNQPSAPRELLNLGSNWCVTTSTSDINNAGGSDECRVFYGRGNLGSQEDHINEDNANADLSNSSVLHQIQPPPKQSGLHIITSSGVQTEKQSKKLCTNDSQGNLQRLENPHSVTNVHPGCDLSSTQAHANPCRDVNLFHQSCQHTNDQPNKSVVQLSNSSLQNAADLRQQQTNIMTSSGHGFQVPSDSHTQYCDDALLALIECDNSQILCSSQSSNAPFKPKEIQSLTLCQSLQGNQSRPESHSSSSHPTLHSLTYSSNNYPLTIETSGRTTEGSVSGTSQNIPLSVRVSSQGSDDFQNVKQPAASPVSSLQDTIIADIRQAKSSHNLDAGNLQSTVLPDADGENFVSGLGNVCVTSSCSSAQQVSSSVTSSASQMSGEPPTLSHHSSVDLYSHSSSVVPVSLEASNLTVTGHVVGMSSQAPPTLTYVRSSQTTSNMNELGPLSSPYVVSGTTILSSLTNSPRITYTSAGSMQPGVTTIRMPVSLGQRHGIASQPFAGPNQRPEVSQLSPGHFRAVAQNIIGSGNVRLAIPRGVHIYGRLRCPTGEQIGQPPIQVSVCSSGNVQKIGIPCTTGQPPLGNSALHLVQSNITRAAVMPRGMLRVSQVGLPNPSVSVAACGPLITSQSPPFPQLVTSTAVTSHVFSTATESAPCTVAGKVPFYTSPQLPTCSTSMSTSPPVVGVKDHAEIKVECSETLECHLAIKQENVSSSGNNSCSNQTASQQSVTATKSGDMPLMSCAIARANSVQQIGAVPTSAGVSGPKMIVQEGRLQADGKIERGDSQESTPQNALLKQLLQTSQPQTVQLLPKKMTNHDNIVENPLVPKLPVVEQHPNSENSSLPRPLLSGSGGADDNVTSNVGDDKKLILDTQQMQGIEESSKCSGKRKQCGQQKRQPKQKANKEGTPAKKRARKGSNAKPEEDFDSYIEATKAQLCTLPPLRILEPDVKTSFNVCPVFGSGSLNPTESKLKGGFGQCSYLGQVDFYSTVPFGDIPPPPTVSLPPTPPPQRGFYNQEFPSRSRSSLGERGITIGPDPRRPIEIPSSLPTPPPYLDIHGRDLETPDTIISSSSPECTLFDVPCKYPGLRLIEVDERCDDNKSASPVIPIFAPIPIRARPVVFDEKAKDCYNFDDDDEDDDDPVIKDKENIAVGDHKTEKDVLMLKTKLGIGPPTPLKDSGNVAITLTLTSAAAEDIRGVLSAVADLLKIPVPLSFEVTERTTTPPSQKLGLYKKGKDPSANIQSILNGQPRFCRHCDVVVLSSGIRKKLSELPFVSKDEQEEDEVTFCSTDCYMQFALAHRTTCATAEKGAATVVDHLCDIFGPIRPKPQESKTTGKGSPTISNVDVKIDEKNKNTEMKDSEELGNSQSGVIEKSEPSKVSTSVTSPGKSSRRPSGHGKNRDSTEEPSVKKWKEVKWKYWNTATLRPNKYKKASEEEINQMLDKVNVCIKPKKVPADLRTCVLCQEMGDGPTNGAARLLNMDVDKWVHLNCALWSAEVYETVNGALMNVDNAFRRGVLSECCSCHRKGATLGCFRFRCNSIYHFTCAMKEKCMFFKDKTMLCPLHTPKQPTSEMKENELLSLAVFRRVYVNRDENKQVASVMHRGDQSFLLRVGSLIFLSVGQLLPHQLQAFHTSNFIYPVGYKIVRMYWSMRHLGKRCQYICTIQDNESRPEFKIHVKEPGHSDIILKDHTAKGVWQQVLEPIDRMRREVNAIKVFTAFITGEDLYGLTEPTVLRVIESLPGVETLTDYNFKYGRSPLLDLPLAINPTGCARSEPKLRTHFKRPHTLHTSSSSRSSFQTAITGLESTCPYTKQFVHSKSSQYRKMKIEWRNNVYLARSRIQGLGLYAAREIEKHTMVIEYIGQLIRNEVAELRESFYEAQNRGIYMFRLDDGRVIDATLSGGLARYINHSCNPNCVAEVVQIDRDNRIIIFANRRIARGEELTYDYKFDIEDDQHKISCLCGAPKCKKWMN